MSDTLVRVFADSDMNRLFLRLFVFFGERCLSKGLSDSEAAVRAGVFDTSFVFGPVFGRNGSSLCKNEPEKRRYVEGMEPHLGVAGSKPVPQARIDLKSSIFS